MKNTIFLTQTDTSIGFVSQDSKKLDTIKQRPAHKHYIKAVDSLATLQSFTRVPTAHKKRLRRASKSTFIFPNGMSYRVIRDRHHLLLLSRLKWAYTTSANLSGHGYDEGFARQKADIIIKPLRHNNKASSVYKLGQTTIKRVR